MASDILYDKAGKEYKVPYPVDRKDWLATGNFFEESPKPKNKKQNDIMIQNLLDDKEY